MNETEEEGGKKVRPDKIQSLLVDRVGHAQDPP